MQRVASTTAPASSGVQMRARICDLLGKKPNRKARVVTFSHKRIHKVTYRSHLNYCTTSILLLCVEWSMVDEL